jgi:DNA-binding NarL/FixJ family response regulator
MPSARPDRARPQPATPHGLEILAAPKADQDLLPIPMLILTTSAAPPDVQRSYWLHTSAYVTKPAGFDSFTDAIRQIARWPRSSSSSRARHNHLPNI